MNVTTAKSSRFVVQYCCWAGLSVLLAYAITMRWCKREHVESNALNIWKLKIFKIIDERVLLYSNNLDLLPPKPKLSFRYLKQGIQEFHRKLLKLLIMLLLCDNFIISML